MSIGEILKPCLFICTIRTEYRRRFPLIVLPALVVVLRKALAKTPPVAFPCQQRQGQGSRNKRYVLCSLVSSFLKVHS